MVKIIFVFILLYLSLLASPLSETQKHKLTQNCLKCHQTQKIPSEMIYRRYLMKYSNKEPMYKAIKSYLKSPKKTNSIMPPQFFLKFPMRKKVALNDKVLEESIFLFLEYFDVKHKLTL